jgi:hypothetical protein
MGCCISNSRNILGVYWIYFSGDKSMSRAGRQLIGSMKGLHQLSARESRREAEREEKKLLKRRGKK